ncbi:222_t:CDS:2 [Funneliformis caledonium]|uniref:222_t:CDS:1 n=1 Tax=Funneliformis caledonium TaxID=1117310 RepID=A0A9N9D5L4_9GLOM|nr:222_t:CDS:2 [Funneliformis caledonium]
MSYKNKKKPVVKRPATRSISAMPQVDFDNNSIDEIPSIANTTSPEISSNMITAGYKKNPVVKRLTTRSMSTMSQVGFDDDESSLTTNIDSPEISSNMVTEYAGLERAKKDLDELNNDILSTRSFTLSNKRIKLGEEKEQEVNQELIIKVYDVEINGITNDTTKQSISSTDK